MEIYLSVFESVEESEAAASLGQVHRGVTVGGEDVAIKIQYPKIKKSITSEFAVDWIDSEFGAIP